MKNKSLITFFSLLSALLLFYGCSVGVLVNIKAPEISHPVSHTDNFYTAQGELITEGEYEVIKPFSFTFTKWGIHSIIEIDREVDISDDLNRIINKNKGDAIVELTISVSDPPVNDLTFFTKMVSLWGSLIFIPLTIAEPSNDYAIIAASSVVVYIFTPGAADINVDGKVVKIVKQ
jgi:hypothetical protein